MEQKELIAILEEEQFLLVWQETKQRYKIDEIKYLQRIEQQYNNNPYQTLLELGFQQQQIKFSATLNYVIKLVKEFIHHLQTTPELNERKEVFSLDIEDQEIAFLILQAPYFVNENYLTNQFIRNFFNQLMSQFFRQVKVYDGSIEAYMQEKMKLQPIGRIFFHLVENNNQCGPFAFIATYSKLEENGKVKHIPLENSLQEYRQDNETLLSLLATVDKVACSDVLVSSFINSGEIFHPLGLSVNEAYRFLQEIPLYETAGITCRIPKWFKNKSSQIKLKVSMDSNSKVKLGMDELLSFNLNIYLGDEIISLEEVKRLIDENEELVFLKGKWVEIKQSQLTSILEKYEQIQENLKNGISVKDALKMQLENDDSEIMEYSNAAWLSDFRDKLNHPQIIDNKYQDNFKAVLRPYQTTGLIWLQTMIQGHFGACLADDMGLGKTIQVLALLNSLRKEKKHSLLIVPATLLNNWKSEIQKFTPSLKYLIAHPSFYPKKKLAEINVNAYDLIITTYKQAFKYTNLKEHNWDLIILDEAQAIKNPGTKQTKEIKQLKAINKIALTGTPIENKLLDLWSLFDFLNPGLLGSVKEFKDFIKNLERDELGYARLKQLTSLFILRRLKTNQEIISDLPEKIEMKEYAKLSKKQIALYTDLTNYLKESLNEASGIKRKGIVLASLLKCKQICNHPDLYLGESNYQDNDSGKYLRLKEICQEIYEKKERVLVFTQFKEMVEPLANFLTTIFNQEGLMLHGSMSIKKRKEAVEIFQSEKYVPFMVLSIKAGGVGLNLTKANHVIHFDRWWNPAIENQATDRAFRIGQVKNVVVHKFVCTNTIEEKIDQLLESKTKLSDDVISTDETWISEMSNDDLIKMFDIKGG